MLSGRIRGVIVQSRSSYESSYDSVKKNGEPVPFLFVKKKGGGGCGRERVVPCKKSLSENVQKLCALSLK